MKCRACNYEHDIDYVEPENNKGDDPFIDIRYAAINDDKVEVVANPYVDSLHSYTQLKRVKLVACQKCGTVRMEEHW